VDGASGALVKQPAALNGLLGGTLSLAYGINNLGQVVGYADTRSGDHAFLYNGGTMVDLNTLLAPTNPGWDLASAQAINDTGQIVGYGYNPSGQFDAFLLTPAPEPATLGLLTFGSLGFLLRRHRQL
jgi:probable HAF family extracellular repeat protein